ncbi:MULTISPECIES: hypothetical protein [unclassified Nonomuraea]|uniref:hypothetical protein n=1 Tax=unclassified Nonomuraea TaxID=2593643 RepID=UPI0033DE4A7C
MTSRRRTAGALVAGAVVTALAAPHAALAEDGAGPAPVTVTLVTGDRVTLTPWSRPSSAPTASRPEAEPVRPHRAATGEDTPGARRRAPTVS